MPEGTEKPDRLGLAELIRSLRQRAASGDQNAGAELKEGLEILAKRMPKDPSLSELIERLVRDASVGDTCAQRELEEGLSAMARSVIDVHITAPTVREDDEIAEDAIGDGLQSLTQPSHQGRFVFEGLGSIEVTLSVRNLDENTQGQQDLGITPA
ncbi:MAG: hypothetical protein NTZ65_05160 [Candidatus Berkelbacteria bacterium]|nr:hypothetical protein [Candidatus Berkelbacteria bacterium]